MTDAALFSAGRKGFIFSLDSALAVIILMTFLITAAFLSSRYEDPYPLLVMQKQANDMLIVLDKTGELATRNETIITSTIGSAFYSSTLWNMELDYYNYSSGFIRDKNTTFGSTYDEKKKIVVAEREFIVFINNTAKQYGVARLRVWPR